MPAVITLHEKHVFAGAIYTTRFEYEATERAVTDGLAKAGEERLEHRIYLIGNQIKENRKTTYVWKHELPIDNRLYESIGEWYFAAFINYVEPEYQRFHPFGSNFILSEWLLPKFGPYVSHRIDTMEERLYQRRKISVELL